MKYFFIVLILLTSFLYSQDKERISDIQDHALEILERVENSGYVSREFYIEEGTIPAIGQPQSRMFVYYEQDYSESHELIETPVAIENYYQYAGNLAYEIYIFCDSENSFYCLGKCGHGSIDRLDNCEWNYEDIYIFDESKLIYYESLLDNFDINNNIIQKKATRRLEQFKSLIGIINTINIPSPPVFEEFFFWD